MDNDSRMHERCVVDAIFSNDMPESNADIFTYFLVIQRLQLCSNRLSVSRANP